ncbi:hypothetical protein, partial [Pseudomonas fluorescens]
WRATLLRLSSRRNSKRSQAISALRPKFPPSRANSRVLPI